MTADQLEKAINEGELDVVVELIVGATEQQRLAAAGVASAWSERLQAQWADRLSPGVAAVPKDRIQAVVAGIELAMLGTCPARPARGAAYGIDVDRAARILAARRPVWLQAWVERALKEHPPCWPLAYLLFRAGAIPRPPEDDFALGLIAAGRPYFELDPGFLRADLHLLFETEGTPQVSMAALDRWNGAQESWAGTLCALAARSPADRAWLLDASLDALARGFNQFRAGWFSRFHDELKPSIAERAARLDGYLGLLGSPVAPTVSFALRALEVLAKANQLPAGGLAASLAPVLGGREMKAALLALKLLATAAGREPERATEIVIAAVDGLEHDSPEVQVSALNTIQRLIPLAGQEVLALLSARESSVAPSVRPQLRTLVGASESGAPPEVSPTSAMADLHARAEAIPAAWRRLAGVDEALAAALQGTALPDPLALPFHAVPQLDPTQAVVPITELEELISVLTRVLEGFGPPLELERSLDGLSRLCEARPADFDQRTAPLRKRAAKLAARPGGVLPFHGFLPLDLPLLVLAWTTGESHRRRLPRGADLDSFHGLRVAEIAGRVARRETRPLLALPTHADRWIDPRILAARIRGAAAWELADAVQALLRLAPDHRAQVLSETGDLTGELADAFRHALGARGAGVGPTAALWVAAARARSPRDGDPAVEAAHPGLGPDAGLAARLETRVGHDSWTVDGRTYHHRPLLVDRTPPPGKTVDSAFPSVLHHHASEQTPAAVRWCGTIWPAGRQAWFARGAEALGGNLDWSEVVAQNREYLTAVLEPDTPLGEMGILLLTMGLMAKAPTEADLAIDGFIRAAQDGRLGGEALGQGLAELAPTGIVRGGRLARNLQTAALAGPIHLAIARRALIGLISADPKLSPGELTAVLALLREFCAETAQPVDNPKAREFLLGLKTGKSGAMAADLLGQRRVAQQPHHGLAAADALRGRLERAERWLGMTGENPPGKADPVHSP